MRISNRLYRTTALIVCTSLVVACGGAKEDGFSAPGIDSGSASNAYVENPSTALPELAAALEGPLDDDFDAIRFLHRSSFGPTDASIKALTQSGYASYIEAQMQIAPTFLLPVTRQRSEPRWLEHINSWMKNSVNAPDQLRQRVAYALSQFFVVSGAVSYTHLTLPTILLV